MSKHPFPSTQYIVNVGYNRYAFDTIEKASRLVELLCLGQRVEYDYDAERRADNARCYHKVFDTTVAEIEAVKAVISDKPSVLSLIHI